MIASSPTSGAGWAWIVAVAVFLGVLVVVALDRARWRRRSSTHEASEALLRTDLADARREIADLRECLRSREPVAGAAPEPAPRPNDPNAPVS